MGQTTRSEWENDMKAHRELLRNVIEEHREGREGMADWSTMIADLQFEEEKVYDLDFKTEGNDKSQCKSGD